MKRIFYGVLVLVWMVCVFCFSGQNGDQSQGTSDVITFGIIDFTDDYLGVEIDGAKDNISFVIRKMAHFSIYFVGGILVYNFLNCFDFSDKRKMILICLMVGVLYAVSDEGHQLLIDGRSGQIRDVIIDSCGFAFGVFVRERLFKDLVMN